MQGDLFSETVTAIYPNRFAQKLQIEETLGLAEHGNEATRFFTRKGTLLAVGYSRIVYGDHGPYLELNPCHLRAELTPKFGQTYPDSYYQWLTPLGEDLKIYFQLKPVTNLPNAPAGGVKGQRSEGYADYRPGYYYVNPWLLICTPLVPGKIHEER